MGIFDPLFSSNSMLNEQIIRELFEIAGDQCPVIAIVNDQGDHWTTDEDEYSRIFCDPAVFSGLYSRVADGDEPVVSLAAGSTIVAAQLKTERVNCGCLFAVLPGYTTDTALANMDLIEFILNQIYLIADLVDKNNQLHHLYLKQQSAAQGHCQASLN